MADTSTRPSGLTSLQGLDLDLLESAQTQVHSWTNASGTDVRFVEASGLPIVDLVLRFGAGFAQDTAKSGLAALTLYMLDEGTDGRSAAEQAERVEGLGVVLTKSVHMDYSTLSLRSLSDPALLEPALALFASMLAKPDFPAPALARLKQQLHTHNRSQQANAAVAGRIAAYRQLFAEHPYGNLLGSTAAGMDAVTVEDLRAFHRIAYSASNLQISLVGDLDLERARSLTDQLSQALPQGWAAAQPTAATTAGAAKIHVERPGASTAVCLAMPVAVPADDPQYLALRLANHVLSAGLQSRLNAELRKRRGLTYGVHSSLSSLRAGGVFLIEWDIASAYVEAAQELVQTLLADFIDQGPTAAELQLARQQLAGQLLRSVARNKSLAGLLAQLAHQQQPADYLDTFTERLASLTPQAVRETLRRRLDLEGLVRISVGPAAPQAPLPTPPTTDR